MTARRASLLAVVLATAGTLLAVVLITWAASIGPDGVLGDEEPGAGSGTSSSTGQDVRSRSDDAPAKAGEPNPVQGAVRVLAAIVFVAAIVLGALAVVLLARPGRQLLRERAERRETVVPDDVAFDVLSPAEAVGDEILADADAQWAALGSGSPRNAIVECWHRFEVAAAAAGVERGGWETSAEFTIRVLDLVDADAPAVSRLAGLYREARFSEHDLTEDDRAAARTALDVIHRTIRRPAENPR